MEYRRLGASGLRVPILSFGTSTFGQGADWPYGTTDAAGARQIVDRCIEAGVTLFDSADVYGAGTAQEVLGAAIAGRRDQVLLSAKAGLPIGPRPGDGGAGRAHLIAACEAALRRLRTDHLDLFTLHAFDAGTPVEEQVAALAGLVTAGKVRYLGLSNFAGWQIMKSLAAADARGLPRYVSQQAYYSLVGRDFELELMAVGLDQGLGTLVWSPLAGGWLAGGVRRGQEPAEGSRVARLGAAGPPVSIDVLHAVVDVLDELSAETGRSVPQVAINWLLRRPTVASVVFGADDEAQIEHNLGAVGWELSDEQVARLDTASDVPIGYPHVFYHRDEPFAALAPPPVRRRIVY
jgi:aryl-alcohol dehydrogenase-like predicted oxidoreductase